MKIVLHIYFYFIQIIIFTFADITLNSIINYIIIHCISLLAIDFKFNKQYHYFNFSFSFLNNQLHNPFQLNFDYLTKKLYRHY